MRDRGKPVIGYVLKRFPRLSETFVLNEILELERQGHRIEIFSLLRPPAEERHALLSELKARITYLPSAKALEKVGIHEHVDAAPSTLGAALATGESAPEPLFNGKSAGDIALLQLKAATVAMLARNRGVEHLHAHFASDAATVALLAARLSGLRFSFTAHARDIYHTYTNPGADNAMRRAKIAEAAFVATVSDYNCAHLRRLAPVQAGSIQRIYNGIDLRRFAPRPRAMPRNLVVAVGRLIEKKGFADLIEACASLRKSNVAFGCRIVGEGPLREQLQQRIAALNLGGEIELAGAQPQERLIETMREANLAVLPCVVTDSGDRDGLPTVLLEAMALGLPVVTTTVSGGPEIVAHGKTGLLVEPGDPLALAASIETILQSPDIASAMGKAGRARAESLFSLSHNVAALAANFMATADARNGRPMLEAV